MLICSMGELYVRSLRLHPITVDCTRTWRMSVVVMMVHVDLLGLGALPLFT